MILRHNDRRGPTGALRPSRAGRKKLTALDEPGGLRRRNLLPFGLSARSPH